MKICAVTCNTVYTLQGVSVEHSEVENSTLLLPGLKPMLKLRHAERITKLEQEVGDDPAFACCSCERLFQ